jgi:ABC-type cobalamin/Fe3+-siderophores transport system ATPase subunit
MLKTDRILHFSDLYQTCRQRVILDVPALALDPSHRYALLGANGAGKSTLLRLLAERLGRPDGQWGYLPQAPYAFSLSVRQNVALGFPSGQDLSDPDKQQALAHGLNLLGLEALADSRGDRLSGGEAQRMALARLLIAPRQILLLDEPGSSLDLHGLSCINQALVQYVHRHQCLLILATHQLNLARVVCDRLLFLDDGRLLADGDLAEQLARPSHPQLQRYLRFEQDWGCESC